MLSFSLGLCEDFCDTLPAIIYMGYCLLDSAGAAVVALAAFSFTACAYIMFQQCPLLQQYVSTQQTVGYVLIWHTSNMACPPGLCSHQ